MSLGNDASLKSVLDTFELVNSRLIDRGGARTITPGTSNQVLAKGNYKGDITIKGDSNLKEENIKKGINLFDIVGTMEQGKRHVSGSTSSCSPRTLSEHASGSARTIDCITINLPFQPSIVIINSSESSTPMLTILTRKIGQYGPMILWLGYNQYAGSSRHVVNNYRIDNRSESGTTYYLPVDSIRKPYTWIAYE